MSAVSAVSAEKQMREWISQSGRAIICVCGDNVMLFAYNIID
jgi:hypothetical protein